MPIAAADLLRKYTTATGPGNSAAGTPNGSLGGFASTTQIPNNTLHNLFDQITGDENAASTVDYRCEVVHNNHASLTWQGPKVWISAEVAGGASAAIGVDPTAASAVGSSSAQTVTIANETTAPTGVSFSAPTTKASGLNLGDLAAGQVKGVWWRRTAANSGALNNDGATVSIEGDTAQ
jgi:hypothetical protein